MLGHDAIHYIEGARATAIDTTGVRYRLASGPEKIVEAKQVVGASGRSGMAHRALGICGRHEDMVVVERARTRAWPACC